MAKIPNKAGFWWASFDDGELVVDTVLLDVQCYHGATTLEEGGIAVFLTDVPGSGRRYFSFKSPSQEIVRPGRDGATANGISFFPGAEVRITWISEIKPPRGLPKVNDRVEWTARPDASHQGPDTCEG